MIQKISLSISTPCLEKFDSFNQTSTGGHCKTCQKNVIDFTKMSQKEIFDYFKDSNKKTCGYFNSSQLKTYTNPNLSIANQNRNWLNYLKISTFLIFINTSWGQNTGIPLRIEQHQIDLKSKPSDIEKSTNKPSFIVRGRIVDEKGNPLPRAIITLFNGTLNTVSDFDGKFVFPKELSKGDRLVVSYLGFKSETVIISKDEMNVTMNVIMKDLEPVIMLGEVSTNKTYVSKPSFFQRLKNLF